MSAIAKNWGDSQDEHPSIYDKLPPSFGAPLVPTSADQFLGGLGVILKNTFTQGECKALIRASEDIGFQAAEEYCFLYSNRLNDRFMSDDQQLADLVWGRVKEFVPKTLSSARDKRLWNVDKLNMRFRFCKYTGGKGHHFGPHTDGVYRLDNTHCSLLTCMIYLNGSDEFTGGTTDFIDHKTRQLKHSIVPESGLCVIFRQANMDCYHLGTEVTGGVKYILRTDVMYCTQ